MQELARQYKESLSILNKRIKELSDRMYVEISTCKKMKQDPDRNFDIIDLKDRLKHLVSMANDLREVTKEVQHYYDRWWWRSEALTCNQRKPRSFIYAGPPRY